jgi:uncharacterized protein (DUF1778 family)
MASNTSSQTRAINLRIRDDVRSLIDRAAEAQGRSRSDFMIDAARRAAEEALLDQTVIRVSPEAFEAFQAMLDRPPQPNERLRRMMTTPAPWEKK